VQVNEEEAKCSVNRRLLLRQDLPQFCRLRCRTTSQVCCHHMLHLGGLRPENASKQGRSQPSDNGGSFSSDFGLGHEKGRSPQSLCGVDATNAEAP